MKYAESIVLMSYGTLIAKSLKEAKQQKHGTGVRRKVAPGTNIQKQWLNFFRNTEN